MSVERAKQKFPCNKCKQLGHWAAECPQKKTGVGTNKQRSGNVVFISHVMGMSIGNYIDANKWYCDSGATKHITPNKQYFESYREFVVPEVKSLGKQGVSMYAHGQRTIRIQVRRNNTWYNVEMKNVFYVPDATGHLFSVKAAASNGYRIVTDDRSVKIQDKIGENTVITGYIKNGLYMLDIHVVKPHKNIRVNFDSV
ncbi:uncharacterized protein LOC111629572 [Centruroides sculpturatus]|uniref:uncharacterized protein LOC111629572 n=1 Tax=Centruroides sculpturatus TaxID=218467 RepID=UPI000C6D418D|nr:uncharacterized protein LOC111629572 [Centruroides sculpturatus]